LWISCPPLKRGPSTTFVGVVSYTSTPSSHLDRSLRCRGAPNLQERQAFPIKAAKGLLLYAPGNHSPQQVLAQTRRWRARKKWSLGKPTTVRARDGNQARLSCPPCARKGRGCPPPLRRRWCGSSRAAPLSFPKIPSGLGVASSSRIMHDRGRLLGIFVIDLYKSRRRLEAKDLFLRHQLSIALRRSPPISRQP